MNKPEATRHLIHSAVRLIMIDEDAFAVHLLIQCATTILRDVARQTNKPLEVDFLTIVRPELQNEIQDLLTEVYNFLKHGIRDFKNGVGIRDIAARNAIELMFCILNHKALYQEYTEHMQAHMFFMQLLMPSMFTPEAFEAVPIQMATEIVANMSPRSLLSTIYNNPDNFYPNFRRARDEDTKDTKAFYDTRFSNRRTTD